MKKLFPLLIILCFAQPLFTQRNKADSLQNLIVQYQQNNDKPNLAKSLFEFGSEILSTGQTEEAIAALKNSSEIYLSLADSSGYAWCLYKISYLYNLTGDYSKSFTYCLRANSIASFSSLKVLEGYCQNLLGRLYYLLSEENSAMEFYEKALQNGETEREDKLKAEAMSYMAIVWRNRDSLPRAMNLQQKALKLRQGMHDESGCASSFLNIGILYTYMNKDDSSAYWLTKAEVIWIKKNDHFNLTECYSYLGKAYLNLHKIAIAEFYFNKSLTIALKIRAKKIIRYNYYDLAMINYEKGDNKKAFDQLLQYTLYKDSVIKDQGLLEIAQLEMRSIKEKSEREIELLNKNNELKESEIFKSRIVILVVVLGMAVVVLLSAFIFRSLRMVRKQKNIIEIKNKNITQSITYAKRIQQSLLPTEKYIERTLKRLR